LRTTHPKSWGHVLLAPPRLRRPWFTPALSKRKSARRQLERIWFHIRSSRSQSNFSYSISLTTEFLLIGLPKQLSKVNDAALLIPSNATITPSDSARNLGEIIDSSLTMSEHISSVSKSCFKSIRDLRRFRNTLDSTTAKTTSIHVLLTLHLSTFDSRIVGADSIPCIPCIPWWSSIQVLTTNYSVLATRPP